MNFEELKQLVDNRVSGIKDRQDKYIEWEKTLKSLKISGFTVVIVYDVSLLEDEHGDSMEVDHALIWNSSSKKNSTGEYISRFYLAHIEKEYDMMMHRTFIFPLTECKLVLREQFYASINDDEVEKIIKNCMKINPLGFHLINTLSETIINEGTENYIKRAIERSYEIGRTKSIRNHKRNK